MVLEMEQNKKKPPYFYVFYGMKKESIELKKHGNKCAYIEQCERC